MKSEAYWNKFYKTFDETDPSEFAVWARPRITGEQVLDVGCGNGRDTLYLAELTRTIGLDPHAPDGRQFVKASLEDYPFVHYDTIYARWFLHAVEEEVEDILLDHCRGQLLIEARVIGDELDNSHYRRPIDTTVFLQKILERNYRIDYFEVSRNFSYTRPLLFRLDATRERGSLNDSL